MRARVVLAVGKGVLFREVSSVQECPRRERERFHSNQRIIHKMATQHIYTVLTVNKLCLHIFVLEKELVGIA